MRSDLKPLPRWRQWWHRTADRRKKRAKALASAGRRGLTLAISVLGVMLISYGVWSVHRPSGYVIAGLLVWAVQWNYGDREGDR